MTSPKSERVPPYGMVVMAIILGAMALLALYANVQKFRRDSIEKVIVTPVAANPTAAPNE